ncbi:MAG: hypothetical protein H0T80_10115 [Betaproteobacteria bacterium]|nr:hypothetical protein [Betaproteobacteria bacterium]
MPRELLPLSTMFRPANVLTSIEKAEELHDLTGLPIHDLVAFRPERLLLHELLIRVTADLSVPSGSRVEDLGINFRQITNAILANHLASRMGEVTVTYDALRRQLSRVIEAELAARLFASDTGAGPKIPERRKGLLGLLLGPLRSASPVATDVPANSSTSAHPEDAIGAWQAGARSEEDALHKAAYRALAKVVTSLLGRHGRIWGTPELIASVATDFACNDYGSEEIGRCIEPYFLEAARQEGFSLLPAQKRPVIMNTKGASAAGKSTMRPEQKALAERIGANWSDFALISPDIWRKQLLDYSSLGAAYKYAGACTGEELHIIDHKLDRYMARKAEARAMSHLLIDRFRFDSFAPASDEPGSNLLTRFGHTVYLFFIITPPGEIVERAWRRGLEFGRYKAVDDLLAHNIEAYSGMPQLFFTWALRADKEVHLEFLDNTVPFGSRPRTVAFGWNGELNVLDVKSMLDVQRFRRVDVRATGPHNLYENPGLLAPENNTSFLLECARRLPRVNFADQATGRIYLCLAAGTPIWADADALHAAMTNPETRAGVLAVAPDVAKRPVIPGPQTPVYLAEHLSIDRIHTLGRWGSCD